MNQPTHPPAGPWTGRAADPHPHLTAREPVPGPGATLSAGAPAKGRRTDARHRRPSRSGRLAVGLALASVLAATGITLTVQPAAPAPGGRPHAPSAR
ncbi:hypothetical protein AB0469_33565 [Streptomyces sp. NPDC093801]|uniref:hypothetical protein n=1 Tax=Streptomyces sp. NPDC093801 TaxID=3155203 RepID=UPI0034501E1A